jgi:short-subunit dehydrogenase
MMNPPLKDWHHKHVWIIGASSGIGLALAKQLTSLNAKVSVSARSENLLNDFVSTHPNSQAFALDVTQPAALSLAFQKLSENLAIDLIIYCAGHYSPMRAQDFNLDESRKQMEINYLG